jgi:serine phosphatase RsbU (regulator of sigma subunit)
MWKGLTVQIRVAAAKVNKYASRESGDTLEMMERPSGGLSFVLADGQGSGQGAKAISHLVAQKTLSLLAEGVRDGAAARAAHDYLYALRQGKVSADLNIVSFDLISRTVVLSRNSGVPIYVADADGVRAVDQPSQPIGLYVRTKPAITEIPIAPGTLIVVVTDGVPEGGLRFGQPLDLLATLTSLMAQDGACAETLADGLLEAAIAADHGRPADDMSVLVLSVAPDQSRDGVRRVSVSFPI